MFRSYTEKVYRPDLKSQSTRSTKVQWFSCDICDASEANAESLWRSETDVEIHRKDKHFMLISQQIKDHGERFCKVCMTLQDSKDALITHMKYRHLFSSEQARRVEREIFICNYCQHIFFNKDVLEVHIQYLHMWRPQQRRKHTFLCPKCKRTCQLRSLWFHMQNHEIPSLSICDICLTLCSNVSELMVHMKEHQMYYKCEICNYQTLKESLYDSHLDCHKATEHRQNLMTLKKLLKETFLNPLPPRINMKYNIHHVIKGLLVPSLIHICVLCREICTDKTTMLVHIARDHMVAPEPRKTPSFRCCCGVQFLNRVLLKHHLFKQKGDHRETADNDPSSSDNVETSMTITTSPLPMEIEENETDERNENDERNETDERVWRREPGVRIEIQHGDPEEPVTTETDEPASLSDNEKSTSADELVYIYAAVNDEESVTIENDNEEIVGF